MKSESKPTLAELQARLASITTKSLTQELDTEFAAEFEPECSHCGVLVAPGRSVCRRCIHLIYFGD